MKTIADIVNRKIAKTWMANYPLKNNYSDLSDAQLKSMMSNLPKYVNDMTEEQKQIASDIYREQSTRYETKKYNSQNEQSVYYTKYETSGKWDNGNTFPKNGSLVSCIFAGIFGMPIEVQGTAKKQKTGLWIVKISPNQPVSGAKTVQLTAGWKVL